MSKIKRFFRFSTFTLKKSNVRFSFSLIFLIIIQFNSSHISIAELPANNEIETVINKEIHVGDTIALKIKKLEQEKGIPKIYFEKNKIPVFTLSNIWYRSLIPLSANTKPGKYLLEIYYRGKAKKLDVEIKPTKYPLQELTLTKEVAALTASKIEQALVAKALGTVSNKKLWAGRFIYPSPARQSTGYGVKRRVNGVINPDYFHKGLDFAANQGSIIKSPEDGKVVLVGLQSKGFVVNGNCIFIDHGHGVISGYLHLSSTSVKEGDFVKKGQRIGKVGSTGIASGPHLHWGVYVLGKTVDPLGWTTMIIE